MTTSTVPASYLGSRPDVRVLVPDGPPRTVLDLGCSNGAVVDALRRDGLVRSSTGIEHDPELAAQASGSVDEVIVGDIDEALARLGGEGRVYDVVIAADILEHLQDPWATVERVRPLVAAGGCVVVSVPHAGHWTLHAALLRGRFPRRDRGLCDATHLRWFGLKDFDDLCQNLGDIEAVNHQLRLFDRVSRGDAVVRLLHLPQVLFAYQLLARVRPH